MIIIPLALVLVACIVVAIMSANRLDEQERWLNRQWLRAEAWRQVQLLGPWDGEGTHDGI